MDINKLRTIKRDYALIIGASSAIAQSIVKKLKQANEFETVLISRFENADNNQGLDQTVNIKTDYSEKDIDSICQALKSVKAHCRYVFICNGLLHNEKFKPEKQLEHFTEQQYLASVAANVITPMLWIKHLVNVVSKSYRSDIVCFSARVASIEDNRLGGWYSYRSSKAALNMLLKTASIEYKRRQPKCKIISFHPGTTDSPLSKPFQGNVSRDKLFNADFVAEQLLNILSQLQLNGEIEFLDWQGKTIAW